MRFVENPVFKFVPNMLKVFFPDIKSNGYTDYPLPRWC
jgi:hypothetical protein